MRAHSCARATPLPFVQIATLILNKRQTVVFSEELQDFIDQAGQRS
jgi:hypothetical protein